MQSSQVVGPGSFVWDDQGRALEDVAGEFERLCAAHPVDRSRVVGGFSMGGETALRLALTGRVPAAGFVLLGPGGPDVGRLEAWAPLLEVAPPLRGAVLLGEEDDVEEPGAVRALADLLARHGVPVLFEVLPGLGHEYPRDEAALERAVAHASPATPR